MTRSTNMEHVEVLRELSARWRASRRAYDGSADDALADCADELDAAIASLSAPQPAAVDGAKPEWCPTCGIGLPTEADWEKGVASHCDRAAQQGDSHD